MYYRYYQQQHQRSRCGKLNKRASEFENSQSNKQQNSKDVTNPEADYIVG